MLDLPTYLSTKDIYKIPTWLIYLTDIPTWPTYLPDISIWPTYLPNLPTYLSTKDIYTIQTLTRACFRSVPDILISFKLSFASLFPLNPVFFSGRRLGGQHMWVRLNRKRVLFTAVDDDWCAWTWEFHDKPMYRWWCGSKAIMGIFMIFFWFRF